MNDHLIMSVTCARVLNHVDGNSKPIFGYERSLLLFVRNGLLFEPLTSYPDVAQAG
jgi:hypothetical protein